MGLPPGPRLPAPLVTYQWLKRPYQLLEEVRREFGETFTIRLMGLPPLVVFSNPEHVREIFTDDGEDMVAGEFNRSLAPLLGENSVLMADGRSHVRKRKLLMPPFHGERMHAFGKDMVEITDRVAAQLARETPAGQAVSLHTVMQDITLQLIVRTVFGFRDGPKTADVLARLKKILELGSWPPLLLPFMQHELGGLSPFGRFKAAIARGDETLYAEIRERRRTGERGDDILSLLLDAKDDAGEVPSELELRDELVTLLVAGHETTATGLTWAFRWLLDQPGAFADVRASVDALGHDPSPEQIAKDELIDSTAREALRLTPVIPIVGRLLKRPTRVGGHDLPAGVVVVCSIYLAHRRPEAFPRPAEFDPTRFVGKKVSPFEFYPFGGGIRRCIGMAFALYEMKIVLARVLAKLDLRLASPERAIRMVRRAITITPEAGLRVTVAPRRSFAAHSPRAGAEVAVAP